LRQLEANKVKWQDYTDYDKRQQALASLKAYSYQWY
jgi:hypothetical protein